MTGTVFSSTELAWRLADATAADLRTTDKAAIYMQLGCGDDREAILDTLEIAARERITVPAILVREITAWLEGYAGSPEETRVRELIRSLTIGFTPLRPNTHRL